MAEKQEKKKKLEYISEKILSFFDENFKPIRPSEYILKTPG